MPVYKSITREEVSLIAKEFGVDTVENYTQLSGGWANSNYKINTDTQIYVLTICETKTQREAEQLVQTLRYLEEHTFHTSICYPAINGQHISKWNEKPVILKSFIFGEMCMGLTPGLAFQLGEQLGKLHLIPSPDFLASSHAYGIEEFATFRQSYSNPHPFLDWLYEMEQYIQPFLTDSLPKCIIHGDIFNDNLIVSPNSEVVIMDFEECCYYYRVYDLGMTILGTCFVDGQLDGELVKKLLSGYRSKILLTPEENKAIIPFAIYAAAGTALWRFRQFNVLFPDEKLKDHYLEMCRFAEMLKALDDEALVSMDASDAL